ncbi:MAG: hypothetical protein HQL75_07545 [Magnetococcales bacterium]|nr:hypothetical protein [Magnetococcales bacterium]
MFGLTLLLPPLAWACPAGNPTHYHEDQTWCVYGVPTDRHPDAVGSIIKIFPSYTHHVGQPNQYYKNGVWHINDQYAIRHAQMDAPREVSQ